jgi:hypothetical protein
MNISFQFVACGLNNMRNTINKLTTAAALLLSNNDDNINTVYIAYYVSDW